MTFTINGTTFPDAATAAAYHGETFDLDEYEDAFPCGFSEMLAWLRFQHPDLAPDDINTLASAVFSHASRPDQDIPSWKILRTLAAGQPVYMPPQRPAWEGEHDQLTTLPPHLHPTTAPTSLFVRVCRKLAAR